MSTESHLSLFGVSVEQANDFILSHVSEPQVIFDAASKLGIPTSMLSEITGYSTDVISDYFQTTGLDTSILDSGSLAGTREIISSEMIDNSLEHLVTLNENTGVLSTDVLRERIIHDTNEKDYYAFFDPANFKGADDGIFTSEELGVSHLGDLPATTETLESLYYGAGIDYFQSVDFVEILELSIFLQSNSVLLGYDLFSEEFGSLLIDIFKDPAEEPYYNVIEIASFVLTFAIEKIELVGIETGSDLFQGALI